MVRHTHANLGGAECERLRFFLHNFVPMLRDSGGLVQSLAQVPKTLIILQWPSNTIAKRDWNEIFKGGQNEDIETVSIDEDSIRLVYPCFVCCFRHSLPWSPMTSESTSWQVVLFDHHGRHRGTVSSVICLWSRTKLFCDSKLHLSRQRGEEFMQKIWAPGSQRVPKSQEFLVEDEWLLLMSPKRQTAHQNVLINQHSIHRLGHGDLLLFCSLK